MSVYDFGFAAVKLFRSKKQAFDLENNFIKDLSCFAYFFGEPSYTRLWR